MLIKHLDKARELFFSFLHSRTIIHAVFSLCKLSLIVMLVSAWLLPPAAVEDTGTLLQNPTPADC